MVSCTQQQNLGHFRKAVVLSFNWWLAHEFMQGQWLVSETRRTTTTKKMEPLVLLMIFKNIDGQATLCWDSLHKEDEGHWDIQETPAHLRLALKSLDGDIAVPGEWPSSLSELHFECNPWDSQKHFEEVNFFKCLGSHEVSVSKCQENLGWCSEDPCLFP